MKQILLKSVSYFLFAFTVCSVNGQTPWLQQEVRTESYDPSMIRNSGGVYAFVK